MMGDELTAADWILNHQIARAERAEAQLSQAVDALRPFAIIGSSAPSEVLTVPAWEAFFHQSIPVCMSDLRKAAGFVARYDKEVSE